MIKVLFVVVVVTAVAVVVFMTGQNEEKKKKIDFNPHPLLSMARVHGWIARDYPRCRTYDF